MNYFLLNQEFKIRHNFKLFILFVQRKSVNLFYFISFLTILSDSHFLIHLNFCFVSIFSMFLFIVENPLVTLF
jgi:hypothetical protein